MIEQIRQKLSGYKTYIAGAAGIIGAVSAWVNGAIPPEKAIEVIWEALTVMFLRAGIKKA